MSKTRLCFHNYASSFRSVHKSQNKRVLREDIENFAAKIFAKTFFVEHD